MPDRVVILPGLPVVFVECKAPGAKPTAAQAREHKRIENAGGRVFVIDSVDAARRLPGGF